MTRGRKPLNNVVKIKRGNPGHRPINKSEPESGEIRRIPPVPDSIKRNKEAVAAWKKYARLLTDLRVIGKVDLILLETLCANYGDWRFAQDQVEQSSAILVNKSKGTAWQNPWVSIRNRAFENLQKCIAEMGMTPSSRSRVEMWKGVKAGDDLFGGE